MPENFAESPTGLLYLANGLDPILRWDGLTAQMETAGIVAPATAPTLAGSGVGSLSGTYTAYVRFLDRFGNVSNFSPISNTATVTNVASFQYGGVPTPADPKVTRRQILRNTNGQAATYYVDVDTTDLTSSTFSSTQTDTSLAAGTAVPLLDQDNAIFANANTPPPNWKSVMAYHLSRMFYLCEVPYTEGCITTTFGSATVQGIGTEWTAGLAGRTLYIVGGDQSYTISSVDTVNQKLTLSANYTGPGDTFALYSIRPAPAERRLVYFSEAGAPESVPAVNSFEIQTDGDDLTGGMPMGSFLFILEERHIHRYTFQANPALDGYRFLSGNRGCLNNRCWVVIEDGAYMMDEQGVHLFRGGQCEPLSVQIQEYFDRGNGAWRVNWSASRYFHAAWLPTSSVIRWFVCLQGHYLPRHALAYDFRLKRWWIEEYPVPIGASAVGQIRGRPVLFLAGPANQVYALGQGNMDGVDPTKGTVRGTVASATLLSITDAGASFDASLAGANVAIVAGKGRGQQRKVAAVTSTTLTVTIPWVILPDSTSVYQAGGVRWLWRSGDYRFIDAEEQTARRVELLFEPCPNPVTGTLRLYLDNPAGLITERMDMDSQAGAGVATTAGDTDMVLDLTKSSGFLQKRFDGRKEEYIDGPRYIQAEFSGYSNQDPIIVYQVSLDGVKAPG